MLIYKCLVDHLYFLPENNVPTMLAYDKDGLKIVFTLEKMPDGNMLNINVTASNNTLSTMTDFLFEAAVPKVS